MNGVTWNAAGVRLENGVPTPSERDRAGREKTIAYRILRAHEKGHDFDAFRIRFDALISHDITYVGIIQTARASGLKRFPVPYALTNCHNSLCAIGGTINEDDHAFGLSAAKKYGGIYVPANQAVIHQYAREKLTGCGRMLLGSDSHTRYGCYGTMGVGEGGGELVKQLLENTWDVAAPEVVLVWLEGAPRRGVGPHDVALAMTAELFPKGLVKNKILEFAGPGVRSLRMDYRIGVDVMTTEMGCLSSIWVTDEAVQDYYETIGRPEAFRPLSLADGAYYDSMVTVRLDEVECMIALPFHPSKALPIHTLQSDPAAILSACQADCQKGLPSKVQLDLLSCIDADGNVRCEQGVIVGCSGGMYENLAEAAAILEGGSIGNGAFDLSVYPASAPINLAVLRDGIAETFLSAGAVMKPCFCGPCFGAGDTPANNTLSIRHATRNFPNREGSKPTEGQIAAVALMDARSIAATAKNGGVLTAATDIAYSFEPKPYRYTDTVYEKRVYNGYGRPDPSVPLRFGPNIADWPKIPHLEENLLVQLSAVIRDEVTTTDELIPSGETSSYRSNPIRLSDFALSRRCPDYVGKSKAARALEQARAAGETPAALSDVQRALDIPLNKTSVGSAIYANRPGDGSAREQAASCQRVLGGFANLCVDYATKRYRSNCINWGIVPFTMSPEDAADLQVGDWVYVPDIRDGILAGTESFEAFVVSGGTVSKRTLFVKGLTVEERSILAQGCLMNYYAAGGKA
ncbi:MAG: hydratase [Clostridia bacterium]|nr:hydratase [Clostridia bacterium]